MGFLYYHDWPVRLGPRILPRIGGNHGLHVRPQL